MTKDSDIDESKLPMLTGVNPKMPAFSKAVQITSSQVRDQNLSLPS